MAALCQAADGIHRLAMTGKWEEEEARPCLHSLFQFNPEDLSSVYGGARSLSRGLDILSLSQKTKEQRYVFSYVHAMIYLGNKLSKNQKMLQVVKSGLERAQNQVNYFHLLHPNVMANLAGIYTDTIGTFWFKLHVVSKPIYLRQNEVNNKIRALTLSGVRSAILWKQLGGSVWDLLFFRKKALLEAVEYWKNLETSDTMS